VWQGLRVSVLPAVPTQIFGVCTGPIQFTGTGAPDLMPAIICSGLISLQLHTEPEFVVTADPAASIF
jgi:hypothetical protein